MATPGRDECRVEDRNRNHDGRNHANSRRITAANDATARPPLLLHGTAHQIATSTSTSTTPYHSLIKRYLQNREAESVLPWPPDNRNRSLQKMPVTQLAARITTMHLRTNLNLAHTTPYPRVQLYLNEYLSPSPCVVKYRRISHWEFLRADAKSTFLGAKRPTTIDYAILS